MRAGVLAIGCVFAAMGCSTGSITDAENTADPQMFSFAGATAAATAGSGGGAPATPDACEGKVDPGRAPLRRLSRFEYNNTIGDVLFDTTNAGSQLPSEVLASTFDLFGNNADSQSVSWPLIKAYNGNAAEIAERATTDAGVMAKLDACTSHLTADNQDSCARSLITSFTRSAFRRVVPKSEIDELFDLYKAYATSFEKGIATVIEAVLQSPDFLYRIEWGKEDAQEPSLQRPTGDEMATRLSYTLWGTAPDDMLRDAADAGELDTADGVRTMAQRMVDDPRSHRMVRFFFDKLLPIEGLSDVTRDAKLYPGFTPAIGSYMHEETQHFLETEIFENDATWKSILTAPYTYVNQPLAEFYGISGVKGDDKTYQKAPLDPTQRLGLLMQGGVMTGTIPTNMSNPVRRGGFVLNALLCRRLSLPTDPAVLAKVKVPEVDGNTARERFTQHSAQPECRVCHATLDPAGFALENFDAVGRYRKQDNGYDIDASGKLKGIGDFKNGVELAKALAESDETHACFASHWLEFAYGHLIDKSKDSCVVAQLTEAFKTSGYNVKQLLVDLTQSDAFLYLPTVRE